MIKKGLILSTFALFILISPVQKARAFQAERLVDPLCIFLCEDEPSTTINQTTNTVNSYNTNSTINSDVNTNSNVNSTSYTPSYSNPIIIPPTTVVYNPAPVVINNPAPVVSQPVVVTSPTVVYNNPSPSPIIINNNPTPVINVPSPIVVHNYDNYPNNYNNYYNRDYYNNNYNPNYYYNDCNYNYNNCYNSPLIVSCSANVSFAPVETNVTWQAYASGGNGYYTYRWNGSDYLQGYGSSLGIIYHSPGTKIASVTVTSGNQSITRTCTNSVLVGVPNYNYNNQYPYYENQVYTPQPAVKYVKSPTKTINVVIKKEAVEPAVAKTSPSPSPAQISAASLFSLANVPWGLVAILIILILLITVIYLAFNKNKI